MTDQGYQIIQGDCLEVMRGMADASVDAVVTDPPYGYAKYPTDIAISPATFAWLITLAGSVAIFGYPERLAALCVRSGREPDEWITWAPTNKFGMGMSPLLPKTSEHIAIFGEMQDARQIMRPRALHVWGRKRARQRGLNPDMAREGDVWTDASPGMACNHHLRNHPNEKPVSLMVKLLLLCSRPGDLILDPFMGSGTTGVACIETGRRFIGIEREASYVAIAEARLAKAAASHQTELAVT
jgi:site-specific DNA-methyltransferase (adenine-specific)